MFNFRPPPSHLWVGADEESNQPTRPQPTRLPAHLTSGWVLMR